MANLSPQAQALLTQFGQEPGVTPDQVASLQAVINSSPPLIDQVNGAVNDGHLTAFKLLPAGTNAGGEYHPDKQEIWLPPGMLTTQQGQPFDMAEPAFVLGHELQHGFNRTATKSVNDTFLEEIKTEAKKPAPSHDYTPAIEKRLAQNRRDEAGAEVAGWNALVGQVKSANPNATLVDIYAANNYRAKDFIDVSGGNYSIKPNLTLNPDMTLSQTAANVEAMGVNYFDKPAKAFGGTVSIGHHGNSDYVNYYGASAISVAVQVDAIHAKPYNGMQPRMIVDMNRLGLSEKLLEENGLFIGQGNPQPKTYYDSSQTPHTQHNFDHTHQSHTYTPVAPGVGRPSGKKLTPDDPDHPDHRLLEQIRGSVRKIDEQHGRSYDDTSERISRGLLAHCKDHQHLSQVFARVDHVVLSNKGENIFAIQGKLDDPAHNRIHLPMAQAAQTPVEQSDQKLEAANQRIAQQQTQEHQLAQQQEQMRQQSPEMSGRAMRF